MTQKMTPQNLSRLVMSYVAETISEEDSKILDQWRAANPGNEAMFLRLISAREFGRQYSSWKAVGRDRPLADMKARISRGRRVVTIISGIAAAIAVFFCGAFLGTRINHEKYARLVSDLARNETAIIHPGETKAILTTTSGDVIDVSNNIPVRVPSKESTGKFRKNRLDRENLNSLSIPRGGEFHITLEDGSEVWLNAQTTLKYPEIFSDTLRFVELVGEGYFKIAKDQSRPFIVKTGNQLVRVYGTEFNINSYDEDSQILTTLVDGSIALMSDEPNSAELMITPGHQAVFNKDDGDTFISQVNTEVVTSWRSGMFIFENQTLDKIMKQLSRWYDFDFSFLDDKSPGIVFRGRIHRYSSFGDVLEIIEQSGNLKLEVSGKTLYISQIK